MCRFNCHSHRCLTSQSRSWLDCIAWVFMPFSCPLSLWLSIYIIYFCNFHWRCEGSFSSWRLHSICVFRFRLTFINGLNVWLQFWNTRIIVIWFWFCLWLFLYRHFLGTCFWSFYRSHCITMRWHQLTRLGFTWNGLFGHLRRWLRRWLVFLTRGMTRYLLWFDHFTTSLAGALFGTLFATLIRIVRWFWFQDILWLCFIIVTKGLTLLFTLWWFYWGTFNWWNCFSWRTFNWGRERLLKRFLGLRLKRRLLSCSLISPIFSRW